MELEGLKRIVSSLNDKNVCVNAIVTDGHKSIQKWLRENWQNVKHYLDVWHVAKGEQFKFLLHVVMCIHT